MYEWEVFIKEAKKKMIDKNLNGTQLAEMTGFKRSTIHKFMSTTPNRSKSDNVAREIAKVLEMEL